MKSVNEEQLIKIIKEMLPIVEAAFYDNHTAGIIPGAGYNHKAEHLVSEKWGWRDSNKFDEWKKQVQTVINL